MKFEAIATACRNFYSGRLKLPPLPPFPAAPLDPIRWTKAPDEALVRFIGAGEGGGGLLDYVPIETADDPSYSGKTLVDRLTGRFYTPDFLAVQLATQMLGAYRLSAERRPVKVIDPFCGDGRLAAALVCQAASDPALGSRSWNVSLWDRDDRALRTASEALCGLARSLNLRISVEAELRDSFSTEIEPIYDLVITNPPWELLKPDRRETTHMTADAAARHRQGLREASDILDRRYPDARAVGAWAGWGTNLARCGWDLSIQLLRDGGVLGIVLPATLLADQGSEPMRRKAFQRSRIRDIAAYPPEARLFDRVDQSVVAITSVAGEAQWERTAKLRLFDADRKEAGTVILPPEVALRSRGYAISVTFGAASAALLDKLAGLPTLGQIEGDGPTSLWMGRELDETRIVEKTMLGTRHPFIKGRMVQRHVVVEQPSTSVRPELAQRFHSARFHRAVWRDVSRASQKRRMIGAVIPPGWIAGNSLHVAYFRDGDLLRTQALHGLLSSLVVEFQVRSRLATGHMSLGVVRQARIPHLTSKVVRGIGEAVQALRLENPMPAARLEVAVAKAYGLTRDDMSILVDSFEKIDDVEKERLLDQRLWRG